MLVFGNVTVARPQRRRQTAQVVKIDPDDLWAGHMLWLREATVRETVAA
jgi:hypothetical protein